MHVPCLGWEGPLDEEMGAHARILAWKIPQTEEPGGLWSVRSQRVRLSWVTECTYTHMYG